jgi:hypothetical protein
VEVAGRIDTGLALRTIHLAHGRAQVRARATLLHASDPAAEEAEKELKAGALLTALGEAPPVAAPVVSAGRRGEGRPARRGAPRWSLTGPASRGRCWIGPRPI